MARCPRCNAEAEPGSQYCSRCGEELAQPCPSCNQKVGAGMSFCPYCGTPVAAAEPEGDVRLATVLFGDVQGYTAMSEHLPAERVTDIMNACFEALSKPVQKYDGTIDKFIGDAIMVRFGAPKAHEDDPVRAIHAALEMQAALTRFADGLEAEHGIRLKMRIGINTGQVLAGQVGSSYKRDFTVMGNTVNLASRLEHAADPGKVLVGEATYRLARHAFEFEARDPISIRGQSEPVHTFVPLRPKATASRADRTDRQVRLIGRETELAQLGVCLAEAEAGQGRLVAVVGEPGVGKSRLTEEFWKQHQSEGVGYVYAAARSFGESLPYSMLSTFVRSLLFGNIEEHEITPEELRDDMLALLPRATVRDAVGLLGEVLGVETRETNVFQMEAKSRQGMLTNILKVLLTVRSQEQPLLLHLEDMHWVDSASLGVFDQLLTGIQNMRVMVLMTHRPRFKHEWTDLDCYRQINVRELGADDAVRFLAEFFGTSNVPPAVSERVMEKGGGNPFFVEQLLNSLVDSEVVVQQDGRWVLTQDVRALAVPDTIQEILLARIDQLPPAVRSVLQVAAVIGREFLYRLLQAVVEAEQSLDDHLQFLKRQEFILERAILPELEYAFKHPLTQEVVYNGMLESRRSALHERVADAIEELGLATANEQSALLAVHYEKTENHEKALEYALAAGDRSRRLYANQEALVHYQQASELLEEGPGDDPGRKLAVLEALGDVYALLATFDEARDHYMQARDAATVPSDQARLWRKLGELAESRGQYAEAITSYRQAEEALTDVDDPVERVEVWLALARMDRSRGALDSAWDTCLRALALVGKVDDLTNASLYFELGAIEQERGHLRSASGYLHTASATWEQAGALEKQAMVENAIADVAFSRGELTEALEHHEKALAIHERLLDRQGMAASLAGIGHITWEMGDAEAATNWYNQALTIAEEIKDQPIVANCRLQLGMIYLDRGDVTRAQELIEGPGGAYTTFKKMRNWRGAAHALVARARLMRARRDVERARQQLSRAWKLAEEMNDPWLQAEVSISEAELEEEADRLERAAERATVGISMGRALSDPKLVARGERMLGRVRARQGHRKEALQLLANSVQTLRRSGAEVNAARAALDYVVAAHGTVDGIQEMLDYAMATFERHKAGRYLQLARSIADRLDPASSPTPRRDVAQGISPSSPQRPGPT